MSLLKEQREKVEQQLREADPVQTFEEISASRAKDILLMARILIDQVGLEKAKELVYKARWDKLFERGRKAAEEMGNPKDVDSVVDWYFGGEAETKAKAYVQKEIGYEERTKTRAVTKPHTVCYLAEALLKYGDPETLQVAEARCIHDIAAMKGFSPHLKVEWTKSFYKGDGCCQFTVEEE